MTRRDKQRSLPIWRAREVWEERWPREAQGLGSMLGSAGWTGLQPAMFTRSGAASGRPVGGRRVLQRDGALGTCAERARARAGYSQPKRRRGISASRARNQKTSGERETPGSTCTQRTPRTPAKLSASPAAALLSRSPSSSPFSCLPPGQRLPCRGDSSHRWENFLAQAPERCPGLAAASPRTHLPWLVAVPLLAGGSVPNDANCTLVKGGGERRGRAGGRTRGL